MSSLLATRVGLLCGLLLLPCGGCVPNQESGGGSASGGRAGSGGVSAGTAGSGVGRGAPAGGAGSQGGGPGTGGYAAGQTGGASGAGMTGGGGSGAGGIPNAGGSAGRDGGGSASGGRGGSGGSPVEAGGGQGGGAPGGCGGSGFDLGTAGVALDRKSCLAWQRDDPDRDVSGCPLSIRDANSKLCFSEAVKSCTALRLDGKADWRLPTVQELQTLVVAGKSPALDGAVFPQAIKSIYWSSERAGDKVVGVDFSNAGMLNRNVGADGPQGFRCVRPGR